MTGLSRTTKAMKRSSKFAHTLSTFVLLVGLALSSSPVQALVVVCPTCNFYTGSVVQTALASILEAITMSTQSIVLSIEKATFTIYNAIGGGTSSLVGSNEKLLNGQKELAQGNLNYDATLRASENFAKAQEQFTAPEAKAFKTCELMAQAQQTVSASDAARVNAKVMTVVLAKQNMYTSSSSVAAKAVMDNYKANYCSAEDVGRGRCPTAAPPLMQGAPTRADVLLSPASNQTYSAEESVAASSFIKMVTNPVPVEQLPVALERAPGGERFVLEAMNAAAQMSVAQHSLEQIKAAKDAPTAPGGNANAAGYSGALSVVGLMKKFTDDKFGSPEYSKDLQAKNEHGLLKELNLQTAFNNWVGYQTYVQSERVEALLATQLAAAARERSERQMALARGMVGKGR